MLICIETHFSHYPGDIWIFLNFIGPFVRLGDQHLLDFWKILKFTINHILRTIFDLNMIFSGMIHLNEYFEIIKIFFHNFGVFALFGGLEGKKMVQKPYFLAYFRGKEGPFISKIGFSSLNIVIRILYCELGKKPHLVLSCGRRGRQDGEVKCGFFPTRFWTARSESVEKSLVWWLKRASVRRSGRFWFICGPRIRFFWFFHQM